jgi:hypothetical protein
VKAAVTESRAIPGVYLDGVPVPYVRGAYGRNYDLSGGTKAVRKYLDRLRQMGMRPDCADWDLLLDALNILTAREREAS